MSMRTTLTYGWFLWLVIVLVVLIFFTKRLRPPAADGQIYRKGEA